MRSNEAVRPYRHEALAGTSNSTTQIRLFRISRGNTDNQIISGTLEPFDLGQCPRYYALSYEWGEEENRAILINNNGLLPIRSNLWKFLLRWRDSLEAQIDQHTATSDLPRSIYLWIDQISIDQSSITERNHQVKLMNQIYKHARTVVVWLGADPDIEACLTGAANTLPLRISSYFNRLWIVQELLVARNILFAAGGSLVAGRSVWNDNNDHNVPLPWPSIVKVLQDRDEYVREQATSKHPYFEENRKSYASSVRDRGDTSARLQGWQFWHNGVPATGDNGFTLLGGIKLFSSNLCADPRDKIFGLLGIIRITERIAVDYSLTTEEVFCSALEMALRCEGPGNEGYVEQIFSWLAHEMGLGYNMHSRMRKVIEDFEQKEVVIPHEEEEIFGIDLES